MKFLRVLWFIFLGSPLLALKLIIEPTESGVRGTRVFKPLAIYAELFEKTKECSGLRGSMDGITWLAIPGTETFNTKNGPKVGMWEEASGKFTVTLAGKYIDHEMVVRHEMLHHLLRRVGHPSEYFQKCKLTWETWQKN